MSVPGGQVTPALAPSRGGGGVARIERSAGGLCFTVPRPVAAGAALAVRAAAAPDVSPWVKLVAVHSTKLGAGVWRVGCQFTAPLLGAVLHLIG